MKIKVYKKKAKSKKSPLRLKLIQDGSEVVLIAVDGDGKHTHRGSILHINSAGMVYLNRVVSPELGLNLDECGRIKVAGDV